MKNRKPSLRWSVLRVLAVFAVFGFAPFGFSDSQNQGVEPELKAEHVVSQESLPKRYDIVFEGGSFVELLRVIKLVTDGDINVIWSKKVEEKEQEFPPLELRKVLADEMFDVLGTIVFRETRGIIQLTKKGDLWGAFIEDRTMFEGSSDSERVSFEKLDDVLERYSLEAITTAIQTSWEMGNNDKKANMKYHPDTKLLIFSGSNEAIGAVHGVLGQLRANPVPKDDN